MAKKSGETLEAVTATWGSQAFTSEAYENFNSAKTVIESAKATSMSVSTDIIAIVTQESDDNGNFGVHTEDMNTTDLPLRAKTWDEPVALGQKVKLRKSFGKAKEQGGYWVNLRLLQVLD